MLHWSWIEMTWINFLPLDEEENNPDEEIS